MHHVQITLLSDSGSEISAVVQYGPGGGQCEMVLRYDENELRGAASDYFDALARIREQLEPRGLIPVCYGASRDVFPSGMARDMGAGLSAYKLTLGNRPSPLDLVEILTTGPDVTPTTIEDQRAFFESWLVSLRATPRSRWQFWKR